MKKVCFILLISGFLFSCKESTNAPASSSASKDTLLNNPISFFPVTSFLKGQILIIDSLPITPLHTITSNNKTDSQWLSKAALKPLLQIFLTPVITETNLTKLFRETSFNDQTLNAITLTYSPIATLPDSIELRAWNVYIDPLLGNVTKVYIVKENRPAKRIYQLLWKSGHWAKITTIQTNPHGTDVVMNEEKFIWNFSEE